MNQKFKNFLSVILCTVLLFTTASVAFAAEEGRVVVDSGYCGAQGENLTWTLYDDGELVISGEGEMDWYFVDYEWGKLEILPPWYEYLSVIDVITVEEGVISIGNDAFSGEYAGYYRINLPKKYIFSKPLNYLALYHLFQRVNLFETTRHKPKELF